jgi:hypothetical protein
LNVFELGFIISTVGGGVLGSEKGSLAYGAVGAVLGALVGAACGLVFAFAVAFVLGAIYCLATGSPFFPKKRPPP